MPNVTIGDIQRFGLDRDRVSAGGSALTLTVEKFNRRSVIATSNSHVIKVANSSDVMRGFAIIADTDTAGAASMFMTAATSDTITLNRSTTGSVTVGEYIEIEDIAVNAWSVKAFISGTGTVATPFSATV
jgi:hypothetical protein